MMSAFDRLMTTIEGEPGLDEAVQTLLLGLSDRIRATSNDQNVQALAHDLRGIVPEVVAAMRAKAALDPSPASSVGKAST